MVILSICCRRWRQQLLWGAVHPVKHERDQVVLLRFLDSFKLLLLLLPFVVQRIIFEIMILVFFFRRPHIGLRQLGHHLGTLLVEVFVSRLLLLTLLMVVGFLEDPIENSLGLLVVTFFAAGAPLVD